MDVEPFDPTPAAEYEAELEVPPPPQPPGAMRRLGPPSMRKLDYMVLALVILAYSITLFARLGHPGKELPADDESCKKWPTLAGAKCHEMIPLDEVHYVPDARDVVRFGTESDTRVPTDDDGAYVVHPPVGKWFIALGMVTFGDKPFGWRFFGCVFAILGVLIAYALARRLWHSPWWGAFAAVLLAVDGLWFVQARVAMLDIYGATFTLMGVWLLVEARDRQNWRWWWAAGLAFGLAIGTKWGAVPMIAVALLFGLRWGGWRAFATMGLIPLIYVVTFTPWFVDEHRYVPPACTDEQFAGRFGTWFCYQREMFNFHRDLKKYEVPSEDDATASASDATADTGSTAPTTDTTSADPPALKPGHPYFGHGYSWPWLGRPVAHHYETIDDKAEEVLGLPNPVTWWAGFFFGIPILLFLTFRRDRVAALLFALIAAGFLPYVAADIVSRPVFLFYATPLVPFLALGLTHVAVRASRRWVQGGTAAVAFVLMAVMSGAFFYPVLAAYPVPIEGGVGSWRARIWFANDCTADDRIKLRCWI